MLATSIFDFNRKLSRQLYRYTSIEHEIQAFSCFLKMESQDISTLSFSNLGEELKLNYEYNF